LTTGPVTLLLQHVDVCHVAADGQQQQLQSEWLLPRA
jgi:hypothetical protein